MYTGSNNKVVIVVIKDMLWFKFFFGLKILKQLNFSFSLFQVHYHNYSETKENKIQTSLKNFKPKKNLNHKTQFCTYKNRDIIIVHWHTCTSKLPLGPFEV